ALEDADLVVEAFDKAERDLVLRLAVGGDAVPMTVDHLGELLVGLEPLPFQAGAPVLEEAPRPSLPLVVPELSEGFLQNIGRVQPLVRGQQQLERSLALQAEVLVAREQRVFLPLDEAPVRAAEPRVPGLADL